MYIIGIDRANLSETQPSYKIVIANTHGKIVKAYSQASRKLLSDIINHPNLLEPAVWSRREFEAVQNLTGREIRILQDIYIKETDCRQSIEKITPLYAFNRQARQLQFQKIVTADNEARYEEPNLDIYYDNNGCQDVYLTALCYNTLLASKIDFFNLNPRHSIKTPRKMMERELL